MTHWSNALAHLKTLVFVGLSSLVASPLAAGDFAFVTNQNSEDLSILDLDARTEVGRVSIPGNPAGVAVLDDTHIYTVSPDSKEIRRIDADGALLARVTLDGGPIGITLDPAHQRVFVSDWYNARIWVLDADTLQQTGVLETGSAPAGMDVSPDGTLLASADRDADQVSIFALSDLSLLHRLPVGTRPFGLHFAPDGRLFVGNVGSDDVTVLDATAGKALATVKVGARPYGVAFAQGRAFVTNQYADTVSVIDLETLAPIGLIDVGEYPEGIDVTGDNRTVVVANWFSNTVSLIDPTAMEVVGEIDTGDGPRAFGTFVLQRN